MDSKINYFIKELEALSPVKAEIVDKIRKTYASLSSSVQEKFIYGGVGFFIKDNLIGGVYSYKDHVSMVFSRGNELLDPSNLLEGEGKYRRHLKIFTISDLDLKEARNFANQVIEIATRIN